MQTFYQNINTLVNNTNSKFRISIYIIIQIISNNNLYLDKKNCIDLCQHCQITDELACTKQRQN